jgi:membrane protease YdiL (CAAX protease family)
MQSKRRSKTALFEVALLFLPAIPAYLWLWPAVTGTAWHTPTQVVVYVYLVAGTLFIGLRRWSLDELGLNRRGMGLSLACGAAFLAALLLGRFATNLPFAPRPPAFMRLAWEVVYYFALVGLIEELLFRGLIYRALDEWGGARLAIWGSALAFGVYHLSQGPLGMFGCFVIGVVFGMIRWRATGIVGLILIHGLLDSLFIEGWPDLTAKSITGLQITNRPLVILCDALLVGVLLYLWKLRPRMQRP